MKDILKMARNCADYPSFKKTARGVVCTEIIATIDDIVSSDWQVVQNPDKSVLRLANIISNLEPTIYLSNGSVLSLAQIRMRQTYDKSEIEFVCSKLYEALKPLKIGRKPDIIKAVKHLLLGCAVSSDPSVVKLVLISSFLQQDVQHNIAKLIGFSLAFGCDTVKDLSDLFQFHYVDRLEEALEKGVVTYKFQNTIYGSRVVD